MGKKRSNEHAQWRDMLYRFCVACKGEKPRYLIHSAGSSTELRFLVTCRVYVDGCVFESKTYSARKKKSACQLAAQNALTILRRYFKEKQLYGEADLLYQNDPLTVSAFYRDMKLPHYSYSGPHGDIIARGTFLFHGEYVLARGNGATKQAARNAASEAMMKHLPFL